jgi:hypothetical protein
VGCISDCLKKNTSFYIGFSNAGSLQRPDIGGKLGPDTASERGIFFDNGLPYGFGPTCSVTYAR